MDSTSVKDVAFYLTNANKAGYATVTLNEKDLNLGSNYTIYFVKDGVVEGYFTAIPGKGWKWSYPQGLIDYVNKLEKTKSVRHVYEEDIFGID